MAHTTFLGMFTLLLLTNECAIRNTYSMFALICNIPSHRYRPKTNLFTLVFKNKDHGFGVPVAFLLTRICDPNILNAWLKALRERMKQMYSTPDFEYNYKPNAVITDQGSTEILAIKTVFPGIPILCCAWHVLKAWERKIRSEMTGMEKLSTKQKKALRDAVSGSNH